MFTNRPFWDELAIQSYKEILKNKPDSDIVHNNLGLAYVRVHRLNKAVRSFQRAVKFNKKYAEAYYHLGTTLQKMGKRTEAMRAFKNYNRYAGEQDRCSGVVDGLIEECQS